MREEFKPHNFGLEALAKIALVNEIVEDYQGQGLRLTLRQLYYQLVRRNTIPNAERSYKNLGNLLSQARLAGLVDWSAIEDRVRQPDKPSEWSSLASLASAAARSYRLPRWADQEHYCEVWVEKDALSGVLSPITYEYHVTLMVNRGYSSQSAMYESAERFKAQDGKELHLFYLGDFDPSGEDMARDVADRLEMFEVYDLDVQKIALNMEQIKASGAPPNPAKMSDSRAGAFVAQHGRNSWELDALPPKQLAGLIRDTLDRYVDREAMDAVIAKEKPDVTKLLKFTKGI